VRRYEKHLVDGASVVIGMIAYNLRCSLSNENNKESKKLFSAHKFKSQKTMMTKLLIFAAHTDCNESCKHVSSHETKQQHIKHATHAGT
jgi:hypothetical protein